MKPTITTSKEIWDIVCRTTKIDNKKWVALEDYENLESENQILKNYLGRIDGNILSLKEQLNEGKDDNKKIKKI